MTASVSVDVFARDRGASSNLRDVGDTAEKSGDKFRKMGALAKAGGLAVAAGVGLAAAAAVKLTSAAMEDAKAAEQLAVSFRNNAGATREQIAATEDWITAQGLAKGVADDELRPALAQLVTATHDVGKAQRLTSLAMDVSAARNVKLATVVKALERAQNGTATGLGKLGVKTKNAAGEARSLHDIMRDLAKSVEGQAGRAANTTAGKFERLKLQFDETGEAIGYKLLPYAEDLADLIFTRVIPGADSMRKAFERNGIDGLVSKVEKLTGTQGKLTPILDEVENSADAVWRIVKELGPAFLEAVDGAEGLLSPLKYVDDVLGGVADALDVVPDGVKTLGIQAGIAALILPRLATGVTAVTTTVGMNIARLQQWRAEMSYTQTRAGAMATAVGKIGGAAKMAAGVGGMLLLSEGMKQTNTTTGTLMTTLGGAATGLAVGGPIGAAVGGLGGLFLGLKNATNKSNEAADAGRNKWKLYAGALDEATGAITDKTRALVYDTLTEQGAFAAASELGISQTTLLNAALGRADAQAKVNEALAVEADNIADLTGKYADLTGEQQRSSNVGRGGSGVSGLVEVNELGQEIDARQALIDTIRTEIGANKQAREELAKRLAVVKGIPKRVTTDIQANGLPKTLKDVGDLGRKLHLTPKQLVTVVSATGVSGTLGGIKKVARAYDLTPKQIRTLIQATGVSATTKEIRKIISTFAEVDKTRPDLTSYSRDFGQRVGNLRLDAEQGARKIADNLKDGTRKARPDLSPFVNAMSGTLRSAKGDASAGGIGIGNAVKYGFPNGFGGASTLWSTGVAGAVNAAIAAGRRAADAHSPSRKMALLGKDMGDGLAVGLKRQNGNLGNAGADLIRNLVKGIDKGMVSAERVLSAIDRRVEQTVDRVKGLLSRRSDTVQAFQGFATSVFATQADEGSPMTVDSLLAAQSGQLDQARQVKGAVARLLAMGMSKSLIAQMQAQGPGGIQQLLTLSGGSQAQIALLNQMNKQTESTYGATGMNVFAATGGAAALAEARRDEAQAKRIAKILDELVGKRESEYEFVLRGDTLVAVLKKHDKDRGKEGPKK